MMPLVFQNNLTFHHNDLSYRSTPKTYLWWCYSEGYYTKIVKYYPRPSDVSYGTTTSIHQKTRRCPTAIISKIHTRLFLEHDYGSLLDVFHQEKVVCTMQNVSVSLRRNVTIFRRPCCSVAEQHANTQSFIC